VHPRHRRHRVSPAPGDLPQRKLAEGRVDHLDDERLLAPDVAVERHRRHPELGRDPAHRQRREPFGVRDRDPHPDDLVAVQVGDFIGTGSGTPGARRRTDHGPDAGRGMHEPVGLQHLQRLGRGRHRHSEVADQCPRRRHPLARPQLPGLDPPPQLGGDHLVRRFAHHPS